VVVLAVAGVLTLGPGWIAVIIALLSLLVVSIIMDARSDVEEFDLKMDSYRLEPNHANDELKYFHFPSNGNNSASKAGTAVNGGDNSDTKEGFIQEPYLPGAANKNEGDKNLSTSAPEPSTLI
jgi:hypothetical protein